MMLSGKELARGGMTWMRKLGSRQLHSTEYTVEGKVARITLDRPLVFNAIDEHMPGEIEESVRQANADSSVKVILLTGKGKAFCSGYDLKKYAEAKRGTELGSQEMPWDPYKDYSFMSRCNESYMSLWRSLKPTIAQINGDCVAGGTDIALACDITFISDEARIVINNAVEMMGLRTTQLISTVFDGMTRHSPEGVDFQEKCHLHGFKAAIADRDGHKHSSKI